MATTVWRPRVRIAVPDIDGTNVDEKRREELTTKGTKRKRAPSERFAVQDIDGAMRREAERE